MHKIYMGDYSECSICGYKLNNKKGVELHPGVFFEEKNKNILQCQYCKRDHCKIH